MSQENKKQPEANLSEWKKLYDAASMLKMIEPVTNFHSMDLIALTFPGNKRVYVSLKSEKMILTGLSIFEGEKGLSNLTLALHAKHIGITDDYAAFMNTSLSLKWGDREDLNQKQRDIIKNIGYKYRGRGNWLYFNSLQDGYYPAVLNKKEVAEMTRSITKLCKALDIAYSTKIKVDYRKDLFLEYYYDKKSDAWNTRIINIPIHTYSLTSFDLEGNRDEILSCVKGVSRNQKVLEVDLFYSDRPVQDASNGRTANLKMMAIADHKTKAVVYNSLYSPELDPDFSLFNSVLTYFSNNEIPAKLLVRNEMILKLLDSLSSLLNIEIEIDYPLTAIDQYIAKIREM